MKVRELLCFEEDSTIAPKPDPNYDTETGMVPSAGDTITRSGKTFTLPPGSVISKSGETFSPQTGAVPGRQPPAPPIPPQPPSPPQDPNKSGAYPGGVPYVGHGYHPPIKPMPGSIPDASEPNGSWESRILQSHPNTYNTEPHQVKPNVPGTKDPMSNSSKMPSRQWQNFQPYASKPPGYNPRRFVPAHGGLEI